MVMLGGVERYVVPGSKPGVHQFSPQFKEDETFSAADMNAIVRDYGRQVAGVYDYTREMGVDISFFIATMRTPFTSMDVLDAQHWIKLGLATGTLPDRQHLTVADILSAQGNAGLTSKVLDATGASASLPTAVTASAPLVQAASTTAGAGPPGVWTTGNSAIGERSAFFSDRSVSVSLACTHADEARLDVTFKSLGPSELQHLRAAAFSAKRLAIGGRQLPIAAVAAPGSGEQALQAVLDLPDLKALQDGASVTISVLDRSGKPAGQSAALPSIGAAQAIADAMSRCGGA
jgi:hypothetical protein